MRDPIADIKTYLDQYGAGDLWGVEHLLARAWDSLVMRDDGHWLKDYALFAAVEYPVWQPPILEFDIEFHGNIQRWSVDLHKGTAEVLTTGPRWRPKPERRKRRVGKEADVS